MQLAEMPLPGLPPGTEGCVLQFLRGSCSKGTYYFTHLGASYASFYLLPQYSSPAYTPRPETIGELPRSVFIALELEANQLC